MFEPEADIQPEAPRETSHGDSWSRAFLGVGSNIRPEESVLRAVGLLSEAPGVRLVGISTFYRTPPLPAPSAAPGQDPDFLNGVLEIRTNLHLEALASALSRVEDALGRDRTAAKYAPRTMDLDLLLFSRPGGEEWAPVKPDGTLIHADAVRRAFVALPLFELDPSLRLPPDGKPLSEIAGSFHGPGGASLHKLTRDLRERFIAP